ncbi:MAG: acetyl-CoA carboxylase biotin carboxyl carrier protein [Rhizobiales bacterium]|nr:acetyl-CoA carboxylase biotin carboxyl carrier protein [Hyphomicrobiales bacterium]
MSLRFEEIAEILKIIDSSSCDELVVEAGGVKLVVRRNGTTGRAELANERPLPTVAPASAGPLAAQQPVARPSRASAPAAAPGQTEVTAPMVGTFYRAPSPDAPPFVEIGTVVAKGQPLCMIEVMKLFTTINAEVAGRVVQIGANNGELVEYGQMIFVVEPT